MNAYRVFRPLILPAVLVLLPVQCLAQRPARFEIVPRAGLYAPLGDVGPAAAVVGPWYLDLDQIEAGPAFEVEARLSWPDSHVGARLVGLASLPADVSGFFNCLPGFACPAVLLRSDAEVAVMGLVLDGLYSPLRPDRVVRPFLVMGAGVKRYHYSWPSAEVFVESGEHTESTLALHAGAGVELDVLGQSFRLEAADWWSPMGRKIGDDPGVAGMSAPRRRAQHDLAVSIGWRLARF